MLIDKKIERYVSRVTANLPLRDRGRAKRELFRMIREMVIDYAGNSEPDVLDARAVLRELGTAEEVAEAWKEKLRSERAEQRESLRLGESQLPVFAAMIGELRGRTVHMDLKSMLTVAHAQRLFALIMEICTVLSLALVVLGLLGLGLHAINSMLPIFVGCIMALLVMTGRSMMIRQY